MAAPRRVLLSWSSGKDSAWALHVLRARSDVEVVGLVTTVNERHQRVAMHAVREALLALQAEHVGLPLWRVPIPSPCSNEQYAEAMRGAFARARGQRVTALAFGDLFLEDVREYRERLLADSGLTPLFPIWGLDTARLAREMVAAGVRARLTCVDPGQLDRDFVGREYDARLLAELPASVDPCGERGEFHTFSYDGPEFRQPVPVEAGEVVERDGFVFADLLPQS